MFASIHRDPVVNAAARMAAARDRVSFADYMALLDVLGASLGARFAEALDLSNKFLPAASRLAAA